MDGGYDDARAGDSSLRAEVFSVPGRTADRPGCAGWQPAPESLLDQSAPKNCAPPKEKIPPSEATSQ